MHFFELKRVRVFGLGVVFFLGSMGVVVGEGDVSQRELAGKVLGLTEDSVSEAETALSLEALGEILTLGERGSSVLDLSVENRRHNVVLAPAGSVVEYEIYGLLRDDDNEGLALFGFDLSFDGGALEQADTPTGVPNDMCGDPADFIRECCDNPIIHFVDPWGLNNPAGFGGTPSNGMLLQIGGGQNTFGNMTPPFPIGSVNVGVANPSKCRETLLVTGRLTVPDVVGAYHLTLSNAFANIIRSGETGESGVYLTQSAVIGDITNLTIYVTNRGPSDLPRKWGDRGEFGFQPGGRLGRE